MEPRLDVPTLHRTDRPFLENSGRRRPGDAPTKQVLHTCPIPTTKKMEQRPDFAQFNMILGAQ